MAEKTNEIRRIIMQAKVGTGVGAVTGAAVGSVFGPIGHSGRCSDWRRGR